MKNKHFLKIVIIVLLCINIATLSFLWIGRPKDFSGHMPPQRTAFIYLQKTLHLNEQQINQYQSLREEHRKKVDHLLSMNHQFRNEMFSLLKTDPVDSIKVKELSDSIASTQQQIELATFYHFSHFRRILQPDQQQKFDKVVQNALKMMESQGHPMPPPK